MQHLGANSLDAWPIFDLTDAFAPRKPLEYAVDGMFALPSLNIVYGPPGSMKSMLMADACVAIAMGEGWLPDTLDLSRCQRVQQSSVLWLDFDNGERRTHERFEALARDHGAPPKVPLYYAAMPSPWLDMTRAGMVLDLIETIRQIGAHFVVIDNLCVISGNADENTVEMVRVMQNLRLVAERAEAAITVIHHQRKSSNGPSGTGRQGDTLRGHSSIEASLDLALRVEREQGSLTIGVVATKARGFEVAPFSASFAFTHKPHSSELETARFWGMAGVAGRATDRDIETSILEALEDHGPQKQRDLVQAVKAELDTDADQIGVNRIRGIMHALAGKGTIRSRTHQSGRTRSLIYELPTPTQGSVI